MNTLYLVKQLPYSLTVEADGGYGVDVLVELEAVQRCRLPGTIQT